MSVEAGATVTKALVDYFDDLERGLDVPPARRFRLEGYVQALLDSGQLSSEQRGKVISGRMDDPEQCFLSESGSFSLPYEVARAPVFKST